MARSTLIIAILLLPGLFLASCDLLSKNDGEDPLPEHGFTESSYFIYDQERTVYRSLDFVMVTPTEDADFDKLIDLFSEFGLVPVTLFEHQRIHDFLEMYLQIRGYIVLRVTSSQLTAEDFYSYSTADETQQFRTHPDIEFSFPVYSYNLDGSHIFYPTPSVIIKSAGGGPLSEQLKSTYNLDFRSVNEQIDSYTYNLSAFNHGSSVDVARLLFMDGEFEFVIPNSYQLITRHTRDL